MPKVTFLPSNQTVEFELGSLPYPDHGQPGSVLHVSDHFGVGLEHVCGGNCSCTTCNIIVRAGAENLSPMDDDEGDLLMGFSEVGAPRRLGCQAVVRGDVVVEIPAE